MDKSKQEFFIAFETALTADSSFKILISFLIEKNIIKKEEWLKYFTIEKIDKLNQFSVVEKIIKESK